MSEDALPPPPPDRDEELRRDISLLGRLLGTVIREQGGEELLDTEERIRLLTRSLRDEPDRARQAGIEARINGIVEDLAPDEMTGVIRCFAIYFQLVNAAEQHHRVRRGRRRDAEREEEDRPQPESLAEAVRTIAGQGVAPARVQEALDRMRVELVATAHPTEISRQTVLAKHLIVDACLERLDNVSITPRERRQVIDELLEEITILWQSDHQRAHRPQVIDEATRILYFFERVLVGATIRVHEELETLLREHVPGVAPPDRVLAFASWAGGDQDGNPNATPDLVGVVLDRHAELARRLLRDRARALVADLSISDRVAPVAAELMDALARDAAAMPEAADRIAARNPHQPYRQKLAFLVHRLEPDSPHPYRDAAQLVEDVRVMMRSLRAGRGERVANLRMQALLRQAEVF
ncbi:MAG: phosphoenolpyruvate carboxylase, partial [Thermoleophilia bacterium]|nr:phosphoenolpyruvate carboxylase [Thermoleophilia bacterium]